MCVCLVLVCVCTCMCVCMVQFYRWLPPSQRPYRWVPLPQALASNLWILRWVRQHHSKCYTSVMTSKPHSTDRWTRCRPVILEVTRTPDFLMPLRPCFLRVCKPLHPFSTILKSLDLHIRMRLSKSFQRHHLDLKLQKSVNRHKKNLNSPSPMSRMLST